MGNARRRKDIEWRLVRVVSSRWIGELRLEAKKGSWDHVPNTYWAIGAAIGLQRYGAESETPRNGWDYGAEFYWTSCVECQKCSSYWVKKVPSIPLSIIPIPFNWHWSIIYPWAKQKIEITYTQRGATGVHRHSHLELLHGWPLQNPMNACVEVEFGGWQLWRRVCVCVYIPTVGWKYEKVTEVNWKFYMAWTSIIDLNAPEEYCTCQCYAPPHSVWSIVGQGGDMTN